jgi:metal-sulfur cluster biosynthetic enzyme
MVFTSVDQIFQNATPTLFATVGKREENEKTWDQDFRDEIDSREIFDLIKEIRDPEHPMSLEELGVVAEDLIEVDDAGNKIDLTFTPTIPHCSMATLIGLTIRVKLIRSLPTRFKVRVRITQGSHSQEDQINRQLEDKERVAAALENANLIRVVNQGIRKSVQE